MQKNLVPHSAPFERFAEIFEIALKLPTEFFPEPNAMTVATSTPDGRPSARVVLLKGFNESGFVFYTNFEGRKGGELLANPFAALCFFWPPLETQIRIEGAVEAVSDEEADAYFASRGRDSKIGAWASSQSRVMESAGDLAANFEEFRKKFEGQEVPRPEHWSGFRVIPQVMEFWYAGKSRLHDRKRYSRVNEGWLLETLYP